MQCRNCGSPIPEGVAFCQQCGTPVNAPSSSSSSLPPTVVAPQPSYGNQNAHTNYNPSSMPGNSQPVETPQNPYGSNASYNAYNPYPQPQANNVPPPPTNATLYAPQPLNNSTVYAPQQPNNASYGYGMGIPNYTGPVPTKPKRKIGLVSGIVIAILAIVIVGGAILIIPKLTHTGSTTASPSGNAIDPTASSIITNIQMASSVDDNTYAPKTLATTFKTYSDIYSTFQFDISGTDVSDQNPGYVVAKYYTQNTLVVTEDILKVDKSVAPTGNGYGYFKVQYYRATTAGSVEIYWCRQSDCSDKKLAQTATFTVTG